jgi:predicted CXXCH cytochrome family protein
MGKKVGISLGLVMLVAAFFIVGLTGTALAAGATGDAVIDGPDYPYVSDPVGTDVTPHNGYSATTDYCLQCHDVHQGATLNYAWLNASTVSAVCSTCHAVGALGGGADPATRGTRFDPQTGGTGTTPLAGPVAEPVRATVSGASWAAGVITYTLTAPGLVGIAANDQVWIWGMKNTPAGGSTDSGKDLNGTYRVNTAASDTSFTLKVTNDPGTLNFASATAQLTGARAALSNTRAYPGSPGTDADPAPGTASVRSAYTVPVASALSKHTIGDNSVPGDPAITFTDPEWTYGWRSKPSSTTSNPTVPGKTTTWTWDAGNSMGGVKSGSFDYLNTTSGHGNATDPATGTSTSGGLMCTSCHTPHGEYGQLINKDYVWVHDPRLSPDAGAFGVWPTSGAFFTFWGSGAGQDPLVGLPAADLLNRETPATNAEYVAQQVKLGTVVYAVNTTAADLAVGGTCTGTSSGGVGITLGDGAGGYCIKKGSTGMAVLQKAAAVTNPVPGTNPYQYWEACVDIASWSPNYVTQNAAMTKCVPWRIESQDGGFGRPDGGIVSAYGYKLLSAYPNHTWVNPTSWGADFRLDDQPSYCAKCHPSKVDASMPELWTRGLPGAGVMHSHPTPCAYCHGNPSLPQGKSNDFPHTSTNSKFLKQLPDGLCISCHTGGLP